MNWIKDKYDQFRYELELRRRYQRDTIFDFFDCLKWWWKERPRKIKCDGCGYPLWFYGYQDSPVYCNENCAFYGESLDDDDIPF